MKIDIISGFLGAGKTTLIKKLLESKIKLEKVAIIENEFGEISIDGIILKKYGIDIKEINSGCICCSLTKDFKESLMDIQKFFNADRIIIEPSGVAKLSDVIRSVKEVKNAELNCIYTVIDALNFASYLENFDEFYVDQIKNAKTIVINDRGRNDEKLLNDTASKIRKINKNCAIITTPLEEIDADSLFSNAESEEHVESKLRFKSFSVKNVRKKEHIHKHVHDDRFKSMAIETNKIFDEVSLKRFFHSKIAGGAFGNILRAKGMIELKSGRWIEFHYTPGMFNIYDAASQPQGKLIFIGDVINKDELECLFR